MESNPENLTIGAFAKAAGVNVDGVGSIRWVRQVEYLAFNSFQYRLEGYSDFLGGLKPMKGRMP